MSLVKPTVTLLANADSVSGDPNTVYKARHPVFQAVHAAVGQNQTTLDAALKYPWLGPPADELRDPAHSFPEFLPWATSVLKSTL